MQGQKFTIQTDLSALKYLLSQKNLTPRLARWALIIQGYDYEIQHVKGSENNVPDALSRLEYDYTRTKVDDYIDNFPGINVVKLVKTKSFNKTVQTNTNNVVTKHAKRNTKADNSDETLCALKQLFQTEGTKQVSRRRITLRETEEILEYDKDRPLMAQLSNKVEYQSKEVKRKDNVLNKIDGEVNIIRTDTSAENNDTENTNANTNMSNRQSKSDKRKQKRLPKLIKAVDDTKDDIDMNPAAILRAQGNDSFCKPILEYLKYEILPRDQKEAGAIVLREEDHVIINGLLYHIFTPLGSKADETKAQLVVPRAMVETILELHHDTSFSGHLSVPKMMSLLRPRYYWPQMMKNAVDYYTSCQTCNATKRFTRTIKPPMELFDISPAPFSHIEIDQIGPLPRTTRCHLYINTVVDLFSKYISYPGQVILYQEKNLQKGFMTMYCV